MGGLQQRESNDSIPAMPPSHVAMEKHALPPTEPEYPSRLGLGLIAIGLCFAVFLFALVSEAPLVRLVSF